MKTRRIICVSLLAVILLAAASVLIPLSVVKAAATAPSLGAAQKLGVLGATAVTNTGSSVITGDVGIYPGTSITGFPPGILVPPGTIHNDDAVAMNAQADALTAYNILAGEPSSEDLTGTDLGGLTLTTGVYTFLRRLS